MKFFKVFLFFALFALPPLFPATCLAEEKELFEARVDADGVQRVEVVAGSYYFDPDHIVVKRGVPVELTVRKKPALIPHTFVMGEKDAGPKLKESLSKEPKTVTLTFEETGLYPFWCDNKLLFFKSHREKGMAGVIEVIE